MKTTGQWFEDFDKHLMEDEKPSVYFDGLMREGGFPDAPPFDVFFRLKKTQQHPLHHPEGDVFVHTMMVVDKAAELKSKSRKPRVFLWAALLHDLGKIPATKVRKGRITAYDHDKLGKKMAYHFLLACGCNEEFCTEVAEMVRWHMQAMFVAKDMPYADIDGMMRGVELNEIALLALCDRLGRGQTKSSEINRERKHIELFVIKTKEYINNYVSMN